MHGIPPDDVPTRQRRERHFAFQAADLTHENTDRLDVGSQVAVVLIRSARLLAWRTILVTGVHATEHSTGGDCLDQAPEFASGRKTEFGRGLHR